MASLYKRHGSRFWWIKFIGPDGWRRRQSTRLRVDCPQQTRKAQALAHELSAKELTRYGIAAGGRWEQWVDKFLSLAYGGSPRTYRRYCNAWDNLRRFLHVRRIRFPAHFTYDHAMDYLHWRQTASSEQGNYPVCQNTALTELRVLGVILAEAVRRGYCERNPVSRLGIKRQPTRFKPAIPDEHLAVIHRALEAEPEWMRVCFTIGLHTGLRLAETRLWLPNVDLAKRTITVDAPKGGPTRAFTIPFEAPELVALLTRLKAERGDGWAFDWPKNLPSKEWWQFFGRVARAHGLPHYCFHCLRVTFITRGAKASVPENIMRKLVNHASTTVHRAYQRLSVEDARPFLARLRPALADTNKDL